MIDADVLEDIIYSWIDSLETQSENTGLVSDAMIGLLNDLLDEIKELR